jgi:hypothetical protein
MIAYDLDSPDPWLGSYRLPYLLIRIYHRKRMRSASVCWCSYSAAYAIVLDKVEDLIRILILLYGCDLPVRWRTYSVVYAVVLGKNGGS